MSIRPVDSNPLWLESEENGFHEKERGIFYKINLNSCNPKKNDPAHYVTVFIRTNDRKSLAERVDHLATLKTMRFIHKNRKNEDHHFFTEGTQLEFTRHIDNEKDSGVLRTTNGEQKQAFVDTGKNHYSLVAKDLATTQKEFGYNFHKKTFNQYEGGKYRTNERLERVALRRLALQSPPSTFSALPIPASPPSQPKPIQDHTLPPILEKVEKPVNKKLDKIVKNLNVINNFIETEDQLNNLIETLDYYHFLSPNGIGDFFQRASRERASRIPLLGRFIAKNTTTDRAIEDCRKRLNAPGTGSLTEEELEGIDERKTELTAKYHKLLNKIRAIIGSNLETDGNLTHEERLAMDEKKRELKNQIDNPSWVIDIHW